MRPSQFHLNRRTHNWIVYKINDRFLRKYSGLYRGKLYDLGCGNAPYREFFMRYAEQYIGVDWSKSNYGVGADLLADLNESLPIESGTADTVVSLSVLEHLYNPEKMILEAYRILKVDGAIVLQVPWQWWIHEAPYDYFRYSPYGLMHLLVKAGFRNVDIEPTCGFFTTWFLKLIYFSNRFIRGPRFWRGILRALLTPIWYILQVTSPVLDKLDSNWALEAQGYFVTARK